MDDFLKEDKDKIETGEVIQENDSAGGQGEDAGIPEIPADGEKQPKKRFSKKKLAIILAAVLVVAIVAAIVFIPSKFERVENECVHIAGSITSGKGYFTVETIPDSWDNMDATVRALLLPSHQESALEAIQYANEELGFPYVYSLMLKTTALMGRQTEENDKYSVSWTYHPDDGLTVTYRKK